MIIKNGETLIPYIKYKRIGVFLFYVWTLFYTVIAIKISEHFSLFYPENQEHFQNKMQCKYTLF